MYLKNKNHRKTRRKHGETDIRARLPGHSKINQKKRKNLGKMPANM